MEELSADGTVVEGLRESGARFNQLNSEDLTRFDKHRSNGSFSPTTESDHTCDMPARLVYAVLVDRFANGDSKNDHGNNPAATVNHTSVADPAQAFNQYHGGDIRGLISKLPYLQSLGVGALLISPLYDNIDRTGDVGAYHGYWGRDYFRPDEHFGSWEDVKELVDACHELGIKCILDFCLSHTNPSYTHEFGEIRIDGETLTDHCNDALESLWYFHKGGMVNYDSAPERFEHDLYGLAKFSSHVDRKFFNPATASYLLHSCMRWIDAGFDGLRLDAIKHVDPNVTSYFVNAMQRYAQRHLGREPLYIIGEWSGSSSTQIDSKELLSQVENLQLFDFEFQRSIEKALSGRETLRQFSEIQKGRQRNWGGNDVLQGIFLDNHDMTRLITFLSKTGEMQGRDSGCGFSEEKAQKLLQIGLALLFTSRGVPVLYYGTESLPATSLQNSNSQLGGDPFNREPMRFPSSDEPNFKLTKELSALRKDCRAFGAGIYAEQYAADDLLVFERQSGSSIGVVVVNLGPKREFTCRVSLADGSYDDAVTGKKILVRDGTASFSLDDLSACIISTVNEERD